MASKWVPVVQSDGEPKPKKQKTETRFVPVAVTRDGRKVPLRVAKSKGAKFRMTKADPKRQAQLEADLRKSREEVGRDLGGNVAAVEVDFGDGRTRRLKGFEAGELEVAKKRPSFADVLLDQKPTRSKDRRR